MQENQPLSIKAPGLLLGDQNPSGGTLSLVVVNGPQHAAAGSFQANDDGSFTYTPAADFSAPTASPTRPTTATA